jgi:uncharacterized protein
MSAAVTYPGIYIEEDGVVALSAATRATAVPVMIVDDNDPFVVASQKADQVVSVKSWLEYVKNVSSLTGAAVDLAGNKRDAYVCAYFENGGGPFYLVTLGSANTSVPQHGDITLVIVAGQIFNVSTLCQQNSGRFAILDGDNATTITSTYPVTSYAAVYYPWLTTSWTAMDIPPSVVMAGVYCATDRARGVWKAPANVVLPANYLPKCKITDDFQGRYTEGVAINMFRTFDGRGTVVWGARTLDDIENWRYIQVQRLFISAWRDITAILEGVLDRPNYAPTWINASTAITNYLYSLWTQGALAGAKEADAYTVTIDETTMTPDDISQGKMIAKVCMAAMCPAEFITLTFSQNMGRV